MKNIYGVYFICCVHNYLEIVKEQLDMLNEGLLQKSKNIIIFISNYKNDITLDLLLEKYNLNHKFILIKNSENTYEKAAINNYKKYILDNDYYIFYFHTKGLKSPDHPLINIFSSRRKILNYYTLKKYNVNITLLEDYDAVGCSLSMYPKLHFSGNFWWSKSSYVNTLHNINDNYLSPEMYILSNDACKCISLSNDTNDVLYENYNFPRSNEILQNTTTNIIMNTGCKELISLC